MVRSSGADDADFALELNAFRRLMMRVDLALVLWKDSERPAIAEALHAAHGRAAEHMVNIISTQALCSALQALENLFNSAAHQERLSISEAETVDVLVHFIVSLRLEQEEYFLGPMHFGILSAFLHAALIILLHAGEQLEDRYRSIVDLVRTGLQSNSRSVNRLKRTAIKGIKGFTRSLFDAEGRPRRSSLRKSATREFEALFNDWSIHKVVTSLEEQSDMVAQWLPPFGAVPTQGKYDGAHGKGERDPDFFSDGEGGETGRDVDDSSISQEEQEPRVESEDESQFTEGASEVPETNGVVSEGSRGSRMQTPSPPRRGKKRRQQHERDGRERRAKSRRSVKEVLKEGRSRKRRREAQPVPCEESPEEDSSVVDEDLLNGMDSQMFPGTDEDDDTIDNNIYTTRHAGSKRPGLRKKLQSGPASPAAQAHREDDNEASTDEQDGSEKDDADRAALRGEGGAVLRDLHVATSNLRAAGIPDPLTAAQQDARRARRRRRSSMVERYSPIRNARPVSPMPESDTTMHRKRRHHLTLPRESSPRARASRGRDSHEQFARSGRYQPYEDELLITGLRKYGWGQWKLISENFGDGQHTRSAISLKDRARTLELDPEKYPATAEYPPSRQGRPRMKLRLAAKGDTPPGNEDRDNEEIALDEESESGE